MIVSFSRNGKTLKTLKTLMPKGSKNERPHVHIVLSDRGWIIEELGRYLVAGLPYVTVDTAPDPAAAIQYYMTYGARKERISPVEIALFTHREEDPNAARRFDEAALAVEHAVSMSNATDRLVERLGVSERSCISPGVDLEFFRPSLKIAVVGRTYHTGRKGEALVSAVMDVPDIEWHFTGEGWPGPALNVPQEELAAFYRSMDYVLVPASNEGGPMCVLEALACGTPVIASDVGWVAEFPHIPFERANAESLRNVLMRLREERFALRESVSNVTWSRWVAEHDALFAKLARRLPPSASRSEEAVSIRRVRSVGLVTHGAEDTTLGGPSVRVPRTKIELERLHLQVKSAPGVDPKLADVDVVHGFNIWSPLSAYRMARQVQRLGRPFVFSPILLDLSEGPFWQAELLRVFRASEDAFDAEARLEFAFAEFQRQDRPIADFEPGYTAALCAINEIAAATIFLSDHERALFERITGTLPVSPHLVRNPVDASQFDDVSPDLFRETYGLDDYVLCVGRIEHRKNQLMLATALASTDLPLVLIGHEADEEYATLVRRFGGERLHVLGRLDPGSVQLRSAIAGARVFALPSWAEGAPLAALEAGAAGVPLVLSDRSGEREYFGEHASYCDPANCASIRDTILEVWNRPRDETTSNALRNMIRECYDWARHTRATRDVYEEVVASEPSAMVDHTFPQTVPESSGIVFDITTWANNIRTLSGIVRVECAIARALLERDDIAVRFVVYMDFDRFVEVPRQVVESGSLAGYAALLRAGLGLACAAENLAGFSDIITVGSSWMQNAAYSKHIAHFARQHGLRLNVLMHDLTPYLFPQWYAEGYADIWTANCRIVLSRADRILAYSRSTARDLEHFCFDQELDVPQMAHIRLADEIGDFSSAELTRTGADIRSLFANRPFVLAVGAIHVRKNYGLLFDVWTMLHETMDGEPPHLVIVGGTAWNGLDVARAIKEDLRVKRYIHILSDVDDGTLAWLYERCLFSVYPSLYEGWGLPVGESLARGRICLASNSSSMAEIAPAVTDLLPPLDRAAWAARILYYTRSSSARSAREAEIRQAYAITPWTKTADDVLAALRTPIRAPKPDVYVLGAIALCNAASNGMHYLDAGWYPCEDWGVWSGANVATLRMSLSHVPDEDVVLSILASVTKRPEGTSTYNIIVNGVACGTIAFLPATRPSKLGHSIGLVRIPREVLAASDEVEIRFETDEILRVNALNPTSSDQRKLGLGLSAFMLERVSRASDLPYFLSTRPEVRAMLKVSSNENMGRLLSENPCRTLGEPGLWCQRLADYVQRGTPCDEGAAAVDGVLALAIGIARLRLDEETTFELLIGPGPDTDSSATLTIYANDELITSIKPSSGRQRISLQLTPSVLGRSDPLRVVLVGVTGRGGDPADFVLSSFRIGRASGESPCRLAVGDAIGLEERVPELAHRDGQLPGPVTLRLALHGLERDSVLLIDAGAGHAASVNFGDAEMAATAGPGGCSLLSIGEALSGSGATGVHSATLTLLPGDPVAVEESSDRDAGPHRHTIRHMLLRSPQGSGSVEASYLLGEGWNEVEDDGRCWGGAARVSFWIRPEAAEEILIVGEVLRGIDPSDDLSISVDGTTVEAQVEIIRDENRIEMRLPLPKSETGVRCIEIGGLTPYRPRDLGINEDERWLSISLHQILAIHSEDEIPRVLAES